MRMDRRTFLGATVVGALTLVSRRAFGAEWNGAHTVRALARSDLCAVLGPDVTRAIGRRYRALVPAESDVTALHAALLASLVGVPRVVLGARPAVAMRVAERVTADFASGSVVVVDGWVLSVTDARQCALFSLLAD